MQQTDEHRSRTTPWRTIVLICRRCGKKMRGGFGPKKEDLCRGLRHALRQAGQ